MTVMPWDEIPDSNLLPTGSFNARGVEMTVEHHEDGRLFVIAQIDVTEPADYASFRQWERFFLGTEEDPNALQPASWKRFPAQRLKQLFAAAQIPPAPGADGLEIMAQSFSNALFGFDCQYYLDDGKNDPAYKGMPRNRISAFWKVGEKQPVVDARSMAQGGGPRAAGPVTAPPLQPVAPPAGMPAAGVPPGGQKIGGGVAPPQTVAQPVQQQPAAAPPGMPAGPPPGMTAGPPPGMQAPPGPAMVAAPPTPQQPVAAPPPQPAAAPPQARAGLIVCTVPGCGQALPPVEFAAHIAAHQTKGEV